MLNVALRLGRWLEGAFQLTVHNVVHLPPPDEIEEAEVYIRTLSRHANVDRLRMMLRDSNGESDELVLPGRVMQLLLTVLAEMFQGNAISLVPRHKELSSQEAASILNVSRPIVVASLEKTEIPHRKVGLHRRVRLADLLPCKVNQVSCPAYHAAPAGRHGLLTEGIEIHRRLRCFRPLPGATG